MSDFVVGKPEAGEFAEYAIAYVEKVDTDDVLSFLEGQHVSFLNEIAAIAEDKRDYRYAEGKWTIKEMIGHIADTERVMSYRAFAFGRGDEQELPGMNENDYADNSGYEARSWDDIVAEFDALRSANLRMLKGLPQSSWRNSGIASGANVSVRGLAYIMGGHVEHHLSVLRERYLT